MKFSDGHWQIPENLTLSHPLHVHEVRIKGDELEAYVAARPFNDRGDQLNSTVFTLRLTAPAEGVIGVRIDRFLGGQPQGPEFDIARATGIGRIEETAWQCRSRVPAPMRSISCEMVSALPARG
ncbi:MAG: hypothetical protein P8X43_07910 [Maritimibacter sp.]